MNPKYIRNLVGLGVIAVLIYGGYQTFFKPTLRCPSPERIASNPAIYDPANCRYQKPWDVEGCMKVTQYIVEHCPGAINPDNQNQRPSLSSGGGYDPSGSSPYQNSVPYNAARDATNQMMTRLRCEQDCSTYGNAFQPGGSESIDRCKAECQ